MANLKKLINHIQALRPNNKDIVIDVFHDVAKLLHKKQERIGKPIFKKKEILSAIEVLFHHYLNNSPFDLSKIGNKHLCRFFNQAPDEGAALDYYEKEMMPKPIKDIAGREISFPFRGMRFLYKDEAGEHNIDPQNFLPLRAKRLPWIKSTIERTRGIYEQVSNIPQKPTQFLYISAYCFSFTNELGIKESKEEPFIVVTNMISAKTLEFVTAYPLEHEQLLNRLEPCRVFK